MRDGFINRTRLLELQRDASDYVARVGEYRSELAVARQRVGELEARIAQARNQYQQQAADELKEASAKVRELEERLRPSQDQVERQMVRSPVDGEVMSMRVSAVGEVIGPREPILDVVPEHEKLVVEARIHPQDIDHVHKDAPAEVRLSAFDARTCRCCRPRSCSSPPTASPSPTRGESWFVATVEVDATSLKQLSADSSAGGYAGGAVRHYAGTHPVPVPHEAAGPVRQPRDARAVSSHRTRAALSLGTSTQSVTTN